MSLTRKASSTAKKAKPPRQDPAAALAEREAELAEARQQQAATAEILRVISQSPTDARPVFERIVVAAARLLRCDMALVLLREADAYVHTAGATPEGPMADLAPEHFPIDASANFPSRAFLAKTMLHLPDWSQIDLPEHERRIHESFGINSAFYLPMLRDDECIGVLVIAGGRPNSFGPSEIAHAETFRDQALIAIENARLFNETQEALEQQKASAEVLGAISKSVADASPVFETILDACQRLFGSEELGIYTIGDDDMVRVVAWRGPRAEEARHDVTPLADSVTGRVIRERRPHHIPDLGAVPNLSPTLRDRVNRHGGASLLYAPMLQEDRGLGSIVVVRWPPRPFSDREQALLQTFADQAAIAIENARLFRETQEALRQQTATGDILKVIASSPNNLQPVLDKIVETACRLCSAYDSVVLLREGDQLRPAAHYGPIRFIFASQEISRGLLAGRAVIERRAIHIDDIAKHADEYPVAAALALQGQVAGSGEMLWRANVVMPLMREGEAVGVIGLRRTEPVAFSETQIQLLKTFADQAVIAIENVRLFDEVQARTKDLQEALQQQTATTNVLKVISRSAFDLDAVLKTLTDSARSLSGAATAAVFLRDGDVYPVRAESGVAPEFLEYLNAHPARPGKTTLIGRVAMTGEPAQIPDVREDPDYDYGAGPQIGDYRSLFGAPLIRDGRVEGVFGLMYPRPRAFLPPQMEMVRAFADQAVIAIENARLFDEVRDRTRDLTESLEQQTAAGEILRVISSSPTDVQPVFDAIAHSAAGLCEATNGTVFRLRDGLIHLVGHYSLSQDQLASVQRSFPAPLDRGTASGRAILSRAVVHIHDIAADPEYSAQSLVRTGLRSVLSVPMLRNGESIGSINVSREESRPFSDRQIDLLKTFADQAVIAVNNVGLFNETEEALERQTATADILKVIASSPTEVQPVFEAIATTANRLLGGISTTVWRFVDDALILVAFTRTSPAADEALQAAFPRPLNEFPPFLPARDGRTEQFFDTESESGVPPLLRDLGRLRGFRSMLFAPLMSNGVAAGLISVTRKEPGAFAAADVQLLRTFADQAVIAIENVRLFDEVQARTRDLTEALEHQTATSEVLSAISRSPTEVQPVFDAIARSATELCGATSGGVDLFYDGLVHLAAHYNWSPEALDAMRRIYPAAPGRGFASARAILTRSVVHIPDISKDPEYTAAPVVQVGFRSVLAVPMLRDGQPIGAIALVRLEPRPFTDRQIALLQTFAEQAVIAINNVRLFDEVQARTKDLQEALEQQTATAEVLKVISRSAFDLNLATATILEAAARLCRAPLATLHLRDGEVCRLVTQFGLPEAFEREARENPIPVRYPLHSRRPARAGEVAHFPDAWNDPEYLYKTTAKLGGYRAIVVIPLMRGDELVGIFSLGRPDPAPFTPSQIKLVQTFADQAAIAIENARMFGEVQARTREVEEALAQQTATAEVLKVISRSAFDLQAVFDTLLASAVELTGAAGGAICMRQASQFVIKSVASPSPEYRSLLGRTMPIDRSTPPGRALLSGKIELIADNRTDSELRPVQGLPLPTRSNLAVPLSRDGRVEGVISLVHPEPDAFTQRHIDLVQTFADQAVIAIENVRLFDEVQARTSDLTEALQQQTATADVLKVISRSAFDLPAVLHTLVESAAKLCDAEKATITREIGGLYYRAEWYGFSDEFMREYRDIPVIAERGTVSGRALLEGVPVHVSDVWSDPEYTFKDTAKAGDFRTCLAIPMLRNGAPIGVLVMFRSEVRPFNARQIELVQTFADQAVIAIENVRLFDEVQARTRDIEEALQQQTATADVLKVISRSVSDVAPVFETILESCQRLLGLESVAVYLVEGDMVRGVAQRGWKAGDWGRDVTPLAGSSTGIAIAERRPLHFPDLADKPHLPEDKRTAVREAGGITVLYAPMLLEDRGVGSIVVSRVPARPFSEKEIALAQSFADQAAIAIQNARMFDEVQARTRDVEEALAQQTATADVLKVISRSAFDLQAVLDTLASSAAGLIGANFVAMYLRRGDVIRADATYGASPEMVRYMGEHPQRSGRETAAGRVFQTGEVQNIPDVLTDPNYDYGEGPRLGNFRALLGVPMARDGKVEGSFTLGRAQPGPFTQRQIELVRTFADQAIIAIENVRLFDEVQARTRDVEEALAQQTATADVLKVISRSAFDLDVVFEALLGSAVSLFGSRGGTICVRDGEGFRYRAVAEGRNSAMWEYLSTHPPTPGRASLAGRVLVSGKPEIIADTLLDSDLKVPVHSLAGSRSIAGVPLLRDDKVEGALMVGRAEAGPFDTQEIELLQTFADQAVIAIENARLFEEVQARTRDLEESLAQQTATADVLKVISRSAFDLQVVFDTLLTSAVKLAGAAAGSMCVRDGSVFPYRAHSGLSPSLVEYLLAHPAAPGRGSTVDRVLQSGEVVCIPDVLEDREYALPTMRLGTSMRSTLGVPLLRDNRVEGALVLVRLEPGTFQQRQIDTVKTFADQAVIAIENVRLFDEVQARTKELAASLDDLRKAQDRLIQSEKLASLGQLTAGIAHEIKNPLNFVNNFSALSRELVGELADVIKTSPLDDARRGEAEELIATIDGNLDKVVQHGKRADSIVKNMLLHSREGSGERSATNINAMVEEALNLAYHGARAEKPGFNVTIVKSLDPNAGAAEVYAQEMSRVLLNLISNGFYATAKRNSASGDGAYEPTITASTRDLGHSVEIAIRDNGVGIPDEVKAKMFNPFFTTKPAGEGTGLGLSLSHDIVVKQHGGTIAVSTELGAFTQFTIVLPRAGAQA